MPPTVLIAPSEHLPALRARADLGEITAFADNEALRALDTITRQRPALVALERMFASTSRGAALINRIKADPSLSACEIRIVSPEAVPAATAHAAVAVAEPPPLPVAPAAPLDQRGTRRAPRVRMADGVDVLVDGNPAALIDLSVIGAQVVSPTILKPNQRLRMSLPDPGRPIRFNAAVAWASFEMPKTGPRYRAGIEFVDADPEAVGRFAEANRKA
ncbi:MAG: PilZ domain-containing protein [Vicinamibacterales bacterium]